MASRSPPALPVFSLTICSISYSFLQRFSCEAEEWMASSAFWGQGFRTPRLFSGEEPALLLQQVKLRWNTSSSPCQMFPAAPCLTSHRKGHGKEVGGKREREKGLGFIMGDLLCVRHLKWATSWNPLHSPFLCGWFTFYRWGSDLRKTEQVAPSEAVALEQKDSLSEVRTFMTYPSLSAFLPLFLPPFFVLFCCLSWGEWS